jgi:7-cyano-7-deazaguanine synthase
MIAKEAAINLSEAQIDVGPIPSGVILGRNALLLSVALMILPTPRILALGIHAGTSYPDCSPAFVASMQGLMDVYSDGQVRVGAPFLSWSKGDIWAYVRSTDAAWRHCYSCEHGGELPCGICPSCKDVEALNAGTKQ